MTKLVVISYKEGMDFDKIEKCVQIDDDVQGTNDNRNYMIVSINDESCWPQYFEDDFEPQFYIIKEICDMNRMVDFLKSLRKKQADSEILIIVHDNDAIGNELGHGHSLFYQIRDKLAQKQLKNMFVTPFYHEPHDWAWPTLGKFIDSVCQLCGSQSPNDTCQEIKLSFQELISKAENHIKSTLISRSSLIRYKFLEPLVALDLATRADSPPESIDGLIDAVESVKAGSNLQELCRCLKQQKDCLDNDRAGILRGLPNTLESEALGAFAQKIEDAIANESIRCYAIQRISAFKHTCDNVWMSMEGNTNAARSSLSNSPGTKPSPLKDFRQARIERLAEEYRQLESLTTCLGIEGAEQVPNIMVEVIDMIARIHVDVVSPQDAIKLAAECVKKMQDVSVILSKVKKLEYNE